MATKVILIFVIVVGCYPCRSRTVCLLAETAPWRTSVREVYHSVLCLQSILFIRIWDPVNRKWSGLSVKQEASCPGWLQTFVTDEVILRIIQGWFTAVKDLLDDGKYNNSTK